MPVDYENLHKERVPLGDGRLRPAVIRRPASAGQPQKTYSPRKRRPSSPGRKWSLEEPRPAVDTRSGHDLRSKESNTKRGRRGRCRLGRCGGAARRWNTPARPVAEVVEQGSRRQRRRSAPKSSMPDRMPVCTGPNMPEWTVIATQRTSRNAGSDCEHGNQKVPGNHRMQALVPGNTLLGGRDLENPSPLTRFTFRAFSEPPKHLHCGCTASRSVAQDDWIWKTCCINLCGSCTARLLCSTWRSGQEGREKWWKEMKREKPVADCGRHSDLEDPWLHRLRSCTARLL